ncbi:MAG TPA: hypothetical protein VH353_13980 [Caulobacteraceae bacterium]|nr:hypothetical protein [Caulobacteraceae bacterium]
MTAPLVMLVALTILVAGPPEEVDISPPAAQVARTTVSEGFVPGSMPRAADTDVAREPPAGSGAEFARYASPPELHNGLLVGGLFAWTGMLIGGLMFLDKRRLVSLVIGGGGLAVGLTLMLTG